MSRELILCALHRIGKPSMAADVADRAAAIVLEQGGWPRSTLASINPGSAASYLSKWANKSGSTRDTSGNNRPLFEPIGGVFNANYPIPEPPRPAREERPLSQTQAQALIQSYDDLLTLQGARIAELDQLLERQRAELTAAADQQRRYIAESRDQLAKVRDRLQRVGLGDES